MRIEFRAWGCQAWHMRRRFGMRWIAGWLAVLVALPGLRAAPENAVGPETTGAVESAPAAEVAGTADVRRNLETLGSLMKVIRTESASALSLQRKIERILQPLFNEVEKATADSRRLEEMKEEKSDWVGRKGVAEEALTRIDFLLAANPEGEINRRRTGKCPPPMGTAFGQGIQRDRSARCADCRA